MQFRKGSCERVERVCAWFSCGFCMLYWTHTVRQGLFDGAVTVLSRARVFLSCFKLGDSNFLCIYWVCVVKRLLFYVCVCAFVLCFSQSHTISNFPSGSVYAEHEVSLSLWIYCKVCISLCVGVCVSVLLYQLDLTVSVLVSCCFI